MVVPEVSTACQYTIWLPCDSSKTSLGTGSKSSTSTRSWVAHSAGTGIHALDTLRYLGGDVVEVDTIHGKPSDKDGGANAFSVLKYDSGAVGLFSANTVAGTSDERYEVHTEDGSLFLTMPQGGFGMELGGFEYWQGPTYPTKSLCKDMMRPYVRPQMMTGIYEEQVELVKCIRENRKSPNDVLEGLKTMLLADAVAKGGHQVVEKP